jgi:predicted O-methyltransferase YrrM
LHMDGDWYESTKAILNNLYDHVVNDGFVQVDDYGYWEGCRKAIHEFESLRKIKFDINNIDGTGVWFQRPDKFHLNDSLSPELIEGFNADDPARLCVDSQMSPNERFQLYYAVRELLPLKSTPLRFVEIGSWAGASLLLIHTTLKRKAASIQGFAVEPGGRPQFYNIVDALKNDVTHLRMFSYEAALQLKAIFTKDNNFPELIFIDGDHTYEGVKRDIIDYYPLLSPGGIMIFHDFLPPLNDDNREAIFAHHGGKEPGIRRACKEVMEHTHNCEPVHIPLLYPTDPTQTQPHIAIIPGVFSTIRAYRKR